VARHSTTLFTKNTLMTLEELKQCDGFTLQVTLDGNDALAAIEVSLSPNGQPHFSWPIGEKEEDVHLLPLSGEDAASLRLNGNENIYSPIRLSTNGGRHRL
jgi:hypothetical protein